MQHDPAGLARRHGFDFGRFREGDTTFSYLAAGPADGPLALCLHGFPESAWTWRWLLPKLAERGWRAVAPWLRGYWPTVGPVQARVHPDRLAQDVRLLHRALGGDGRSVVIGHDWGAVATYGVIGGGSPFRAAVTLAVPHLALLPRMPWNDPRQAVLSWYAMLLALPGTSGLLRAGEGALVRSLWRRWSPGYEPTPLDLDTFRAAISRDGGRTVAAYYRATVPALLAGRWATGMDVAVPLLHLAGADDGCMHAGQSAAMARVLPEGSRSALVAAAGHFLHLERPDHVADLVLDHLGPAR